VAGARRSSKLLQGKLQEPEPKLLLVRLLKT
jgi:hypothetical protein